MHSIITQWNFTINNVGMNIILCVIYLIITGFRFTKRTIYFFEASCIVIICTASPLYFIGEHYLFAAHMLAHVLLLLIAGPLMVMAIPEENILKRYLLLFSRILQQAPLLSWLAGVCIMWLWHLPFIYNQLMPMKGMHTDSTLMIVFMNFHTLSLIVAGILFSWLILTPYKLYRIAPLTAILYLSSACVCCSLLGLIITFAPSGMYTSYISNNSDSFLSIIRNQWNISLAADQQIAGLIMWVPCCFIYLTACMIILIKWFEAKDLIKEVKNTHLQVNTNL